MSHLVGQSITKGRPTQRSCLKSQAPGSHANHAGSISTTGIDCISLNGVPSHVAETRFVQMWLERMRLRLRALNPIRPYLQPSQHTESLYWNHNKSVGPTWRRRRCWCFCNRPYRSVSGARTTLVGPAIRTKDLLVVSSGLYVLLNQSAHAWYAPSVIQEVL